MDVGFLLVHSPSVGPSTWTPVAETLRARGHTAVVPRLTGVTAGPPPYWPRVVSEVTASTPRGPLAVVAHSNAGLCHRHVTRFSPSTAGRPSINRSADGYTSVTRIPAWAL
ncbi:hypothetical protein OHB01_23090 [Microbispora hainanensis]|uniref:Alpha/beta hydrolase n=1 Tax=Microbispora hainanensis TaxID=568844 RepID=A0ABZ1STX1_9ACTN|nr:MULTISPECIES: hypothetical protein [Microbispora]NJP22671.1 hypothetical protein [Microbispora sp. CL1-1]TQS16720.1 hypothetical protein FLW53_00295 [Microbispora sp. SCL1-1]